MTRSNKKAGLSPRKQPDWRRSRKSAHRSSGASTSLRKPTLRSTPPPALDAAPSSEPPLDERPTPIPTPSRRAAAFEPPPDERPTPVMSEARTTPLVTERPVALTLTESDSSPSIHGKASSRPSSRASSRAAAEKETGSHSWLLAAAALVLVGVAWFAFENSGPRSSNSDASASKADAQAVETPVAAAAPALPSVPAAPESGDVAEEEVIDLDAPEDGQVARTAQAAKPAKPAEVPSVVVPSKPTAARVSSAKPAAKTEPLRPQEAAAGPFDSAAAQSALTTAAAQASSCRQDGDPTGVARVVVTFAPSGRVTSATISGPPFAGTQTGSCIAKTMRGMTLPAFTGDHMTVSKTVVIM